MSPHHLPRRRRRHGKATVFQLVAALLILAQAALAAQVGTHEPRTGSTDAYLSIHNKPLLTNTFDPSSPYDVLADTTFQDGQLQLQVEPGTDIISSFEGTRQDVVAGNDLVFPVSTVRTEVDVWKDTPGTVSAPVNVRLQPGMAGQKANNVVGDPGLALMAHNGQQVAEIDWTGSTPAITTLATGLSGAQPGRTDGQGSTWGTYYAFPDGNHIQVVDRRNGTSIQVPIDAEYQTGLAPAPALVPPEPAISTTTSTLLRAADLFNWNGELYYAFGGGETGGTPRFYRYAAGAWQDETSDFSNLPTDNRGELDVLEWNGKLWAISAHGTSSIRVFELQGAWAAKPPWASGLGDIGSNSAPTIFTLAGTTYMIAGRGDGLYNGFRYTGSMWTPDSDIINGLASTASLSAPTYLRIGTTDYLIVGKWDGLFSGYAWTGTTWVADAGIINGLTDIGSNAAPAWWTESGTHYLIVGTSVGGFSVFRWTGSTWTADTAAATGLSDQGQDSHPAIVYDGADTYVVAGYSNSQAGSAWKRTGSTWSIDIARDDGFVSAQFGLSPAAWTIGGKPTLVVGTSAGTFEAYQWFPSRWGQRGLNFDPGVPWDADPFIHAGGLHILVQNGASREVYAWNDATSSFARQPSLESGLSYILTPNAWQADLFQNGATWHLVSAERQLHLVWDGATWSQVPLGRYAVAADSWTYDTTLRGMLGTTEVYGTTIHRNTEPSSFAISSGQAEAKGVAIGDLDGTGGPDLAIYGYGGLLIKHLNNGSVASTRYIGVPLTRAIITDLDGDLASEVVGITPATGEIVAVQPRGIETVSKVAGGAGNILALDGGPAQSTYLAKPYDQHGALIRQSGITLTKERGPGEARATPSPWTPSSSRLGATPQFYHYFNPLSGDENLLRLTAAGSVERFKWTNDDHWESQGLDGNMAGINDQNWIWSSMPANYGLRSTAGPVVWETGGVYFAAAYASYEKTGSCQSLGSSQWNNRYTTLTKGWKYDVVTSQWVNHPAAVGGLSTATTTTYAVAISIIYAGGTARSVLMTEGSINTEFDASCNYVSTGNQITLTGRSWSSSWTSDTAVATVPNPDPTGCPTTTCHNYRWLSGAYSFRDGGGRDMLVISNFNQYQWTGSAWSATITGAVICCDRGGVYRNLSGSDYVLFNDRGGAHTRAYVFAGASAYGESPTWARGLNVPSNGRVEVIPGTPNWEIRWNPTQSIQGVVLFAQESVSPGRFVFVQWGSAYNGLEQLAADHIEGFQVGTTRWLLVKTTTGDLQAWRNTPTGWIEDAAMLTGLPELGAGPFDVSWWQGQLLLANLAGSEVTYYRRTTQWQPATIAALPASATGLGLQELADHLVLLSWGGAGFKMAATRDGAEWRSYENFFTNSFTLTTADDLAFTAGPDPGLLALVHTGTAGAEPLYKVRPATLPYNGVLSWTEGAGWPRDAGSFTPLATMDWQGERRIIQATSSGLKGYAYRNAAWIHDAGVVAGLAPVGAVVGMDALEIERKLTLVVLTSGSPYYEAFQYDGTTWLSKPLLAAGLTDTSPVELALFEHDGRAHMVVARSSQIKMYAWNGTWTTADATVKTTGMATPYSSFWSIDIGRANGRLYYVHGGSQIQYAVYDDDEDEWRTPTILASTAVDGTILSNTKRSQLELLPNEAGFAVLFTQAETQGSHRFVLSHQWRNPVDDSANPNRDPFAPACTISAVAQGDYDSDGYPDFVSACSNGAISLHENEDRSLTTSQIGTSPGVIDVHMADIDEDGTVEVLAISPTRIDIYRRSPTLAWLQEGSLSLPAGSWRGFAVVPRQWIEDGSDRPVTRAYFGTSDVAVESQGRILTRPLSGGQPWAFGPAVPPGTTMGCRHAQTLFLGTASGELYSHVLGTSTVIPLPGPVGVGVSAIWCTGHLVVAYQDGSLRGFTPAGVPLWGPKYPDAEAIVALNLVSALDMVAVLPSGKALKFDHTTGQMEWGVLGETPAKDLGREDPTTVHAINDTAFAVGYHDGTLAVHDAGTAQQHMEFDLGRPVHSLHVTSDGAFILAGLDRGHVAKIRTATNAMEWGVKGLAYEMPLGTAPWRNEGGSVTRTLATGPTWVQPDGDQVRILDSSGTQIDADLAYYEPLRVHPTQELLPDAFVAGGLQYGIAHWDILGTSIGLTVLAQIEGQTTTELAFYYLPDPAISSSARFLQGGYPGLVLDVAALEDSRNAGTGSFTSQVLAGYYTIQTYQAQASTTGGASYTIRWRSGTTLVYDPLSWSTWTTGLPPTNPYYQFQFQFTRNPTIATSGVTVSQLQLDWTRYPAQGTASLSWSIPSGHTLRYLTLDVTEQLAAGSSIQYHVRGEPGDPWQAITPGVEHDLGNDAAALLMQIQLHRVWDTPRLDDVTIVWRSTGEGLVAGATTRTAGSASEINVARATPTESLGASVLAVPVSDKVTAIMAVLAGQATLSPVGTLAAVTPGTYFFDAEARFVYVGVNSQAGNQILREIRASYGADFDFVMPSFLRSGDYLVITGTLRDREGLPVQNLVAEVSFLKAGNVVYGPIQKFIAGGNIEASIPTNYVPPGTYDVRVTFRDTNNIVFTSTNPLILGQSVGPGTGGVYSDAAAHFKFFDADTGLGLASEFLRVLATDDGSEPTGQDRVVDNRIPTATGQTVKFRVEDYWAQQVYPEPPQPSASFAVTAVQQVVDVGLDLANFKIKNTNSSVVHFFIQKGAASISQFILPQEIVSFDLLPGDYLVKMDYYNSVTGAFQTHLEDPVTVESDTFYWIRGHDLADIVIEITNVGSNLANQIVNVGVTVNNINSTVGNQVASVVQTVNNLNATIGTQLNSVLQQISNLGSHLDTQINNVLVQIANTNSTIHSQVNRVETNVTNTVLYQGLYANVPGATHHWPFLERTGTKALDYVGDSDATLQNGPTWTTGRYGSAIQLDGTNDLVTFSQESGPAAAGSVEAWFKRSSTTATNRRLVDLGGSGNNGLLLNGHGASAGQVACNYGRGTSVQTIAGGSITDTTTFHHAVCNWGPTGGQLYLDNVLVASSPNPANVILTPTGAIGGASAGGSHFAGAADEVVTYNRPLTAAEVDYQYRAAAPFYQFNAVQTSISNQGSSLQAQISSFQTTVDNEFAGIGAQVNAVGVQLSNTESTLSSQLNLVDVHLTNQGTAIGEQFNELNLLIENHDVEMMSQVNSILALVENTNGTILDQANAILSQVANTRIDIRNQTNALASRVSNAEANLTTQVNVFQDHVENRFTQVETQVSGVTIAVTNLASNVSTQSNLVVATIQNTGAQLSGQVNSVHVEIENLGGNLSSQINQVLTTVRNSNTSLAEQVNLIRGVVENTEANITTQFNGVHVQLTTFESRVENQFTVTRSDVQWVNSTIVNHVDGLNSTVAARMLGLLDTVAYHGDRLFNRSLEVLGAVFDSQTNLSVQVQERTVAVLDAMTLRSDQLYAKSLEILDEVLASRSTLTQVVLNRTLAVMDNLTVVQGRLFDNTQDVLAALDALAVVLDNVTQDNLQDVLAGLAAIEGAFHAPHTVYVPAFNYTALSNDTLPPVSSLDVSQSLDPDAVILRWLAKDNVLVKDVAISMRREGEEWSEIGRFASSGGDRILDQLELGRRYDFRIQATDMAGNVERIPTDERQPNYASIIVGASPGVQPFEPPPDAGRVFTPAPAGWILALLVLVIAWRRRP